MKNLILMFALLIATAFASCTNGSASRETVNSAEVDTVETVDSIVVEADTLTVDSVM